MSRKSPSQFKILNDTLDIMTLMTHARQKKIVIKHLVDSWRMRNFVVSKLSNKKR